MKKIVLLILILFVAFNSNSSSQGWVKIFENDDGIFQLAVNSKNEIFAIAYNINHDSTSWLFMSQDNGKSWNTKNMKFPYYYEYFFENYFYYYKIKINSKDDIFIAMDTIIIRSTDNGNSFKTILDDEILYNLFGYHTIGHHDNNFEIAPNNDIYISCYWGDSIPNKTGYQTIISTNNGDSWEIIAENTYRFAKLSFGQDGNVYMVSNWSAYCSSDTCKTWIQLPTDSIQKVGSNVGYPLALGMDNNDNLFILTEINSIIKSSDYGKSWSIVYLSSQATKWGIHIEASNNGWIFAPKFYSIDNGNNWNENQLDFDYLYTHDSTCYGIYRRDELWKFSNDPVNVESPYDEIIFEISPNPAREYIEINVVHQLSESSELSESYHFQIYNVYGEQIAVGAHCNVPVRIDVSAFPDGIYFIRMGNEFQKFVVMR